MRQVVEPSAGPAGQASRQWRQFAAEHLSLLGVLAAVGIGFGVRAAHILSAPFPLNDGGLFYAMARDLQEAMFRLPETTSYNASSLPFTYSPLGLYVAALLDNITPFDLFDLFRLLPLIYTTLSIFAFYLLAKRILPSRIAIVTATLAFALIPRSFIWLLMGGGVTRGLGLLLALLALHEVHRTFTTFKWRHTVTASLLAGATVLTHLETGWFLAFSCAIFFLAFGKERFSVMSAGAIAGGTFLVALPWLAAVVSAHGIEPFVAANNSGGSVFSGGALTEYALTSLARLISTSEPYFPLIAMLGVIGLLSAVKHRLLVLPAWWAATILLDVRAFPTYTTIPVAMLAGMAVSDVVLPMLDRGRTNWEQAAVVHSGNGANGDGSRFLAGQAWFPGWQTVGILAFLLVYAVVGAMIRKPGLGGEGEYLTSVTDDQRAAMKWIAEETPPDSKFLVVPRTAWQVDKESEWFPVLAERQSVATVQGTEWSEDGGFDESVFLFDRAWDCGYQESECLTDWVKAGGREFTHVYLTENDSFQCCTTLRESLEDDPKYVKVYDGPGGTIFRLVGKLPLDEDEEADSS